MFHSFNLIEIAVENFGLFLNGVKRVQYRTTIFSESQKLLQIIRIRSVDSCVLNKCSIQHADISDVSILNVWLCIVLIIIISKCVLFNTHTATTHQQLHQ